MTSRIRIRVNTNTSFYPGANGNDLARILRNRNSFDQLFDYLLIFILRTAIDHRDSEFDCRDSEDKKLFLPEYNCKEFTDVAIRACEHDMLAFIERHYKIDDFEVFCGTEVETAVCCECNSLYNTDLFPTVYGTMCRQCVASYVVRQLRLSRFPLRIPLLSSSGSSPIDLLYAILPQSVVSLIIKKSYAHFYTVDHPEAVFTQCPRCSTPFVLPQRSEFSICTCSICGCFCEWSKRWEAQYFFETFNLDEGERLLRIKCYCGRDFFVGSLAPANSAHGAICPYRRCKGRLEQEGFITWSHLYAGKFRPRYRKEKHKRGEKNGQFVTSEHLEVKKLTKKEFAKICVEARKQRLSDKKRAIYERTAREPFSCEAEIRSAVEFRKTVLYVVENCTAWLYLHQSDGHQHLKSVLSQLLRSFLKLQEEIMHPRPKFNMRFENLRSAVTKTITTFHQLVNGQVPLPAK
ncbi:hypothetical protein Aduo_008088 [Ancylostoma duodenale]